MRPKEVRHFILIWRRTGSFSPTTENTFLLNLVAATLLPLCPQTDPAVNREQGEKKKGATTSKCNHRDAETHTQIFEKCESKSSLFFFFASCSLFSSLGGAPCRWGYIHYLHLFTLPRVDSSLLLLVQSERAKQSEGVHRGALTKERRR